MNKRKIDINELKKTICRGKKIRAITVKYDTVLAYFKHKDTKDNKVFHIGFLPLITDLLEQLTTAELVQKVQREQKDDLKQLTGIGHCLKLDSFELKTLSKQYPIKEICECLFVEGQNKRYLSIQRNKLISFFKNLRNIYADFCSCARENLIIESVDLKAFYEMFKIQWSKSQQKGRESALQKLQKKICRSLYFLGILIENNILDAIESAQRRKREEEEECGTRSEHQRNMKGIGPQVSTVHSINSLNPSNPSTRLKSQTSNEQSFPMTMSNKLSQTSKKSQRVFSRSRYNLWDKAQIRQLRFVVGVDNSEISNQIQVPRMQINYLTNDVQNILIEQAFKMQKFTDSRYRNESMNPYQFVPMGYSNMGYQYNNYYMGNYLPYSYPEITYHNYQPYTTDSDTHELNQLKRSLGCLNLVQTRKKDNKDRYQ